MRTWSRVKYLCGTECQMASSSKGFSRRYENQKARPGCYIAVEMDQTEASADVYYGKILRLLEVNIDERVHQDSSQYHETYHVALIQWAESLLKGSQGQVFKSGSRENAFGSSTIEDVTVIRRLDS